MEYRRDTMNPLSEGRGGSRRLVAYALVATALLALGPSIVDGAAAQQSIIVESDSFGTTNIITFENDGGAEIGEIRMWLSGGATFESFTLESIWSGDKNSVGTLVFTADPPLGVGQSARFIIVTDVEGPAINWKARSSAGDDLQSGLEKVGSPPPADTTPPEDTTPDDTTPPEDTTPDDTTPPEDTTPDDTTLPNDTPSDITDRSVVRAVPSDPGAGSTIRVVGSGFASGAQLEVLLNGSLLPPLFTSDDDGRFIVTRDIPEGAPAGSATLSVRSLQGDTIDASIRITDDARPEPARDETPDQDDSSETVRLRVSSIPSSLEQNQPFTVAGTGEPGRWVVYEIKSPNETLLTTGVQRIDLSGSWSAEIGTLRAVASGTHTISITDTDTSIERQVGISETERISVTSTKKRYSIGETMTFTGDLRPNQQAQASLEDRTGKVVMHRLLDVDSNGDAAVSYTTSSRDLQGDYVMIIRQGANIAVSKVGLVEDASHKAVIVLDRLDYDSGDTIKAHIFGNPNARVTVEIIEDVANNPGRGVLSTDDTSAITLGPDGTMIHSINTDRIRTGAYHVTASWGGQEHKAPLVISPAATSDVNVSIPPGPYKPGSHLLVNINTGDTSYALASVELINPDNKKITNQQVYTNELGIHTALVHVPDDAKEGVWKIEVFGSSDQRKNSFEFNVVKQIKEGLFVIYVSDQGGILKFSGTGAGKGVQVEVTYTLTMNGKEVHSGATTSTKEGTFVIFIPSSGLDTGEYKLEVTDRRNTVEVKFTK